MRFNSFKILVKDFILKFLLQDRLLFIKDSFIESLLLLNIEFNNKLGIILLLGFSLWDKWKMTNIIQYNIMDCLKT